MPGLSLQGTVGTEVQLEPKQRVALLKDLRLQEQKRQTVKKLEAEIAEIKSRIEAVREESGMDSFGIDGYTVTLVAPVRDVLNQKKLVALGCKTEWLEKATEKVPSTPYTKVTAPK
jgi:hypothetical protein